MGPQQLPMFRLKVFLKLCLQEAFVDLSAVKEVLEVGQVSCSPAELPVVAGPKRPQFETLCCFLVLSVVWLRESKTT